MSNYRKELNWSSGTTDFKGFDEVATQAAGRSSFFHWSSNAGRYSVEKTNFAEVERILESDVYKLFGRVARIKNMKGVKDG